jgi:putative sterol carrier protein
MPINPCDQCTTSRSRFRPELAGDLRFSYDFHIDGHVYEVCVEAGMCTTREGTALNPDTVMALDAETLNPLMLDGLSPQTAITEGRLSISGGDATAVERFVAIFAIRQPVSR